MVPGSNPNVWKPQTWIVRSSRVQNPANHIEKISTAYLSRFSGFEPRPGRTNSKSWPLHFQKKFLLVQKNAKHSLTQMDSGIYLQQIINWNAINDNFFCRLMRVLHFLDRWKKQETDEEEENKILRRRSNRNCFFFGQFRIDDGDYDGGD